MCTGRKGRVGDECIVCFLDPLECSSREKMEEYERDSCIPFWSVAIGEVLECVREPSNEKDRYAVAV